MTIVNFVEFSALCVLVGLGKPRLRWAGNPHNSYVYVPFFPNRQHLVFDVLLHHYHTLMIENIMDDGVLFRLTKFNNYEEALDTLRKSA